jgi:hypothetical protein
MKYLFITGQAHTPALDGAEHKKTLAKEIVCRSNGKDIGDVDGKFHVPQSNHESDGSGTLTRLKSLALVRVSGGCWARSIMGYFPAQWERSEGVNPS